MNLPRIRNLAVATAVALGLTVPVAATSAQAFPTDPCSSYSDCNQLGGHIARAKVVDRAMKWVNSGQFYSQDTAYAYNGTGENGQQKWRRDCSGFVSMAWRLRGESPNYGRWTGSLNEITGAIPFTSLQRGDILLDTDGMAGVYSPHVMIFDGWINGAGGDFFIIEENPSYGGAVRHPASTVEYLRRGGILGRADAGDGFAPRRYDRITNS